MKLTQEDIKQFLEDRVRSDSYRDLCSDLLVPFQRWLGDRDLMERTVKRYARERYVNPNSHNTFLAVMKSFADYKMKRLPQDDFGSYIRDRQTLELIKDIQRERVVERLERKELSEGELKEIFGSLEGLEFSGLWSLAWFGPRPGELLGLKLKDINKKPDRYLPPPLAEELGPDDYCIKFLTEKTVVERALFMDGFTRGHLENFITSDPHYTFLYDTCVDLQEKVGVEFTPKWFRSTFQTKFQRILTQAGVPIVKLDLLVKVMSGHTVGGDITGIYTEYGSDIKKAMLEHHYLKSLEEEFK